MDDNEQSYEERENAWDEQWPGSSTPTAGHSVDEIDNLDEQAPFPGSVGTDDALAAVRDGEPYTPAIDPPVLPGGREGIHVATGFGMSAEEEAQSDVLPRGDEDLREEAILVLRQDSLTARYAIDAQVEEGVVRLTGPVPTIDDGDYAATLISNLPGVVEVIDDTSLDPTLT